ncbi:GPW/gp25 family protein [Azohydromonas aeria]|uniref:GPW/gp25 family protein n=1 Tax=Azohydromonas aeria TaxID=2590212 RepID=UPI0012F83E7D|nr:GPW/gp25 family protein [Azohydromonas aeria]
MAGPVNPFAEPIGWPLLPVPDAQGRLQYPDLARSVREMIQVLLSTRPGEQLMRPGFGAGLENLLTEPNTVATRARIKELVEDALKQWEPRIVVDGVAVDPVADPASGVADGVRVEIAYRLKRTGTPARVGLTLVMESRHAH